MKPAKVYGFLDLTLPDHIANWDVLSYWEKQRWASMFAHLGVDDNLFIMGAEHGFVAATYAVFAPRVILFEPTAEFWPNIRLTWEANGFLPPQACVQALVGDQVEGEPIVYRYGHWPRSSQGPEFGAGGYRHLNQTIDRPPVTTIDHFVTTTDLWPAALSIDVEGAELIVLNGARATLEERPPKVWVSIHPDLMARDYGHDKIDLLDMMQDLGYRADLLAVDHEEHWLFLPDR